MSLDRLLLLSRVFPPGTITADRWPRLSEKNRADHTYDPPKYRRSEKLQEKLLNYFEEEIYFEHYIPSQLAIDGVMQVIQNTILYHVNYELYYFELN